MFWPRSSMRRARLAALAGLASFWIALSRLASAGEPGAASAWCRSDLVTLQGDVCYAPGPPPMRGEPRTLVIFLHGLTEDGSSGQLTQQEAMARAGKAMHFSMLAPRGRNGLGPGRKTDVIAWPTSEEGRREAEEAIWARIDRARQEAEDMEGAPYDDVFVVGFSNGAYYASSLALRGRLAFVDGYAVIAGGSAATKPTAVGDARKPVFIGVAARDETAKKGRELDRALRRAGWPHLASEKGVGHVVSDDHLAQALRYLRAKTTPRGATRQREPTRPQASAAPARPAAPARARVSEAGRVKPATTRPAKSRRVK